MSLKIEEILVTCMMHIVINIMCIKSIEIYSVHYV